jgi:hypothetical protein
MDKVISREVENLKSQGKEFNSRFGNTTWTLPSHLVSFLSCMIENIENQKLKIQPWNDFKK